MGCLSKTRREGKGRLTRAFWRGGTQCSSNETPGVACGAGRWKERRKLLWNNAWRSIASQFCWGFTRLLRPCGLRVFLLHLSASPFPSPFPFPYPSSAFPLLLPLWTSVLEPASQLQCLLFTRLHVYWGVFPYHVPWWCWRDRKSVV